MGYVCAAYVCRGVCYVCGYVCAVCTYVRCVCVGLKQQFHTLYSRDALSACAAVGAYLGGSSTIASYASPASRRCRMKLFASMHTTSVWRGEGLSGAHTPPQSRQRCGEERKLCGGCLRIACSLSVFCVSVCVCVW